MFGVSASSVLRFGSFDFDPVKGELRRNGVCVELQPQPSKLLALLACNEGHLVLREEIRHQIWKEDIFVDFDKAINFSVRQIRAALGDRTRKSLYIQTVHRRGYRFIAPVSRVTSSVPAASAVNIRFSRALCGRLDEAVLAVLPFQNLTGESQHEHSGNGLTEILIDGLARTSTLRVISRTTVMKYKGPCKTLDDVAKDVEATAIVEGAILRLGTQIRITVRLVDTTTEQVLWAASHDMDGQDVLPLKKEVERSILDNICTSLAGKEERRSPAIAEHFRFDARNAYANGLYYWNKRTEEGLRKGIEHFEQAIKKDPSFALAYATMADCYVTYAENGLLAPHVASREAKAASSKALDLDPTLAEAHASLAHVKMIFDWDWPAAEMGFKRAIECNPCCPTARQWYADCLTAVGRHDEALTEITHAWRLDPSSFIISADVGWNLCYARRYDKAIEHYRGAIEREEDFPEAVLGLGEAYLQKLMFEDAIRQLRMAVDLTEGSPKMLGALAHAYAVAGQKTESLKLLTELKKMSRQRYVPSYEIAAAYWGLRDLDKACDWFARAAVEGSAYMIYMKTDPRLTRWKPNRKLHTLLTRLGRTFVSSPPSA
jgi:TolB-like protein/DNA-binding winged helix-turn-helix (wHTH) protein/Flp pilus assembly protein TadD